MTKFKGYSPLTWIVVILGLLALAVAFISLQAWVFMVLWNAVVPTIFHGPALTFWSSMTCTFLLSIIGGFFRSLR